MTLRVYRPRGRGSLPGAAKIQPRQTYTHVKAEVQLQRPQVVGAQDRHHLAVRRRQVVGLGVLASRHAEQPVSRVARQAAADRPHQR